MRLLDLIAQSSPAQSDLPPTWVLPGPHHFAEAVHACPLRLVLADDLVRCATALGLAEGDRLSGCLDLLRVPSERLWVEWAEGPRRRLAGKSELLEHVEVRTSIQAQRHGNRSDGNTKTRFGRRLHHVRGHLARRGYKIFWRSPHLRGNARLGVVRSRTVELTFH
jgi:hypothetical protein